MVGSKSDQFIFGIYCDDGFHWPAFFVGLSPLSCASAVGKQRSSTDRVVRWCQDAGFTSSIAVGSKQYTEQSILFGGSPEIEGDNGDNEWKTCVSERTPDKDKPLNWQWRWVVPTLSDFALLTS